MRISADSTDPGRANYDRLCADWPGHIPVVRLDGERLEHVLTADEERGEVTVYCLDRYKNKMLHFGCSGEIQPLTRTYKGVVRIVWEPRK